MKAQVLQKLCELNIKQKGVLQNGILGQIRWCCASRWKLCEFKKRRD